MAPRDNLEVQERAYREDLANVQEVVLELNRQEDELQGQRSRVARMQKDARIRRQRITAALEKRTQLTSTQADRRSEALSSQLRSLEHRKARLKATEQQIDKQLAELDARRQPFVESQQKLLGSIERNVAAQHKLHFETKPKDSKPMKTPRPDDFHRASNGNKPEPSAHKPINSKQRLDELSKRLEKAKPAPELHPPGMAPNLAKRAKANKAIGDEMARIKKAINARRGQARGGFKRSAGG